MTIKKLNVISEDKISDVHVDNNLVFSDHIDNIAKKKTSNIWLLSKIKRFLSVEHRVQFYKTYIQSHLDYCTIVWGCTSQTNLQRLFRLHKKACKIMLDYNVNNIFESMESLNNITVYERIFYGRQNSCIRYLTCLPQFTSMTCLIKGFKVKLLQF